MCGCICIFQDSLCRCSCFPSFTIIKPHVMGYWYGSRALWCLLVKFVDSIQTTLDTTYSNSFGCSFLYGSIYRTSYFCTKFNSTGTVTTWYPDSQWGAKTVSIAMIYVFPFIRVQNDACTYFLSNSFFIDFFKVFLLQALCETVSIRIPPKCHIDVVLVCSSSNYDAIFFHRSPDFPEC